MKPVIPIVALLIAVSACSGRDSLQVGEHQPWSKRIADSFLLRHPGAVTYDTGFTERKWNYEQGLMLWALYQMSVHSGGEQYYDFVEKNLDQYIDPAGRINMYKRTDYNLDLICPGRALLMVHEKTKNDKYRFATDTLRRQLREQPRTHEGGFWHKKIYPYQMWLDGLYMAEPFYALYARLNNEPEAFNDIANQFLWVEQHTLDPRTGLYFHGWDESKQMGWADKATGCSPSLWGRAMGWYAMGLVDVLDNFPQDNPQRAKLMGLLRKVCAALLQWRDKDSGLWHLIVDQGSREGNYLEASSSAMFTYVFAKGARNGYLDASYAGEAERSFNGILRTAVTVDSNGFIDLHHTIKGAGLGNTPYHDGTFAYYAGEQQRTNDMKGIGPFLLAAMEIEKGSARSPK